MENYMIVTIAFWLPIYSALNLGPKLASVANLQLKQTNATMEAEREKLEAMTIHSFDHASSLKPKLNT